MKLHFFILLKNKSNNLFRNLFRTLISDVWETIIFQDYLPAEFLLNEQ